MTFWCQKWDGDLIHHPVRRTPVKMFRGESIEFEDDMMAGQFENVNLGSPRVLSNVPRGSDLSDPTTSASLRSTAPLGLAGAQGSMARMLML